MHFFFLGNKVDFLSSDHMKLWASSPCSGMWTKQKQTLERESSKFMAVSTCSVCQYLWCHNQIKTIPSAIYISTVLRLHKFMSRLLSRFKTIQMFRTLKNQTIYFHIHFIFSLRERKLSSLIFLLKSARMRRGDLQRGEDQLCASICNAFRELYPQFLVPLLGGVKSIGY